MTALFQLPEVSKHLDPPPATIADFGSWIALSQSRRAEGRAACYSSSPATTRCRAPLYGSPLRADRCQEIGFAIAAPLGGVFKEVVEDYLDFLFNAWASTLVGKTHVSNVRAMGAMRKVGAKVIEETVRNGQAEYVWTIERPPTARRATD